MAENSAVPRQDMLSRPPTINRKFYYSPRTMCLTSKPVILLLLWVLAVSGVLTSVKYGGVIALPAADHSYEPISKLSFIYITCFYALLAVMTACYIVSGFIADVCCGRYRMVTLSMGFLWIAVLMLVIVVIITLTNAAHIPNALNVFRNILIGGAFFVAIPGLSGFYSNMIQLGLDQLQDAPSNILGIFLHWIVWVSLLGEAIVHVLVILTTCPKHDPKISFANTTYYVCGTYFTVLSVLLVINCFSRRWFVATETHYNPYKMVLNVIRFVRTHKHPIRHSALHWTNGEKPSRFDFAKHCYGGPFTSGQVEDVKTLGRVVLVLLAIGPVFVLSVPTSYFLFPFFSFHATGRITDKCTYEWIFIKSGTLGYLVDLVCLPVLIWIVYCVLRNRVPKILTRMEIGILLSILGVFSMLIIDLVGHNLTNDSTNSTHCMFLEAYHLDQDQTPYYTLQLPWYILTVPNLLNMFSQSLVLVTTYEFISAQTPQAMKGLMFGAFFAIKGGYSFLGAISLIPFSLKFWITYRHTYVSCGFSYFFFTLIVSLTGLVMFACASRRYKYRMREEEPFPQAVVEEIFERRLEHANIANDDNSDLLVPQENEMEDSRTKNPSVKESIRFLEKDEDDIMSPHVRGRRSGLLSASHDWYGTF